MRKIVIGVLAVAVAAGAVDLVTFDRAAWAGDYAAMKRGMAQNYANLDWIAEQRKLDLAALDKETSNRLEKARSHFQAYAALNDFVAAFHDPHLKLEWGRSGRAQTGSTLSSVSAAASPGGANCDDYEAADSAFHPRMAALPGWRPVASDHFPTAIAGGLGVIRIAAFGEDQYLTACQRVGRAAMGQRELQLATRAELQRELIATIGQLKRAGAKRLLIDLTGNGGGSEWNVEAAALFTAKPMTRHRPRLADAPCDRSAVWRGSRPCAVFKPGEEEVRAVMGSGTWDGPVAILADSGTASAAEEFIGWLVDNHVAKLIGERTTGAGCGYVDGGRPVALKSAPLTLKMPNCARYSAAGRNEIEGWEPHVALKFPDEGQEAAWAKQLMAAVNG